jgi:hypothetical protein
MTVREAVSYRDRGALVRERQALGVTLSMPIQWFERAIAGNHP